MKNIFVILLLSLIGCDLDEQMCFWKQHRQDVKPVINVSLSQTQPIKLTETKLVGNEDGNIPAPDFSVDANDANRAVPVAIISPAGTEEENCSISMTNTEWIIIIGLFMAVVIIALAVRKKANPGTTNLNLGYRHSRYSR
jgi:hypothetical protein